MEFCVEMNGKRAPPKWRVCPLALGVKKIDSESRRKILTRFESAYPF